MLWPTCLQPYLKSDGSLDPPGVTGVDVSTPLLSEGVPGTDADPVFFFGGRG